MNVRVAARTSITLELWLFTIRPSSVHASPLPVVGTSRHSKPGQHNRGHHYRTDRFKMPRLALLDDFIPETKNHRDLEAKATYTNGSKTDEGTGSAYCILENYGIIASWQGKLDHSNSMFQADILAIKMAIEAASSLHRPIKIWTDSLMAVLNPKSHHSMVREIQTLLLSHKQIHLRWLKAHVGYLGNECADQLGKEDITKGDP
ncbi:hypothetical protein AVEN_41039-1 [Araneus ventricosus]|uniref:RNase H type-1 domain-containing protein n=1 Tax=Araneus ventricosus TaxID=182803 RepID=A0A4Y2CJV1_ARAVE|nr:hypothetical protein AVEN_41039-1 [Araneus ventricosus]